MRTKHIDVRYHFIHDLVESGILTLEYVPTEDNHADIMTKNTTANILGKLFTDGVQVGDIVTKRENVRRGGSKGIGTSVESNILVDDDTHATKKGSCETG